MLSILREILLLSFCKSWSYKTFLKLKNFGEVSTNSETDLLLAFLI